MSEPPFQRMHPLGMIVKTVSVLKGQLWLVPAIYVFFGQNIFTTLLSCIAIFGLAIAIAVLHWTRFGYHLGATEVRIRSGILGRYYRSIPYERIQDISLEQQAIPRILGLATLKLETGAGEDELGFLGKPEAEELRVQLREQTSGSSRKEEGAAPEDEPESASATLFTMSKRRLLVAGLFNFSFIFFAAIAAGIHVLEPVLPDLTGVIVSAIDASILSHLNLDSPLYGFLVLLLGLLLIGMVGGIVRTFLRDYGFRLDLVQRARKSFRRRRGLFTLTDLAMPVGRIQAAVVRTGLIRRSVGFYELEFQLLASDGPDGGNHSAAPFARQEEIASILAETEIEELSPDLVFENVHPVAWWRTTLKYGIVLAAIAVGSSLYLHPSFLALILVIVPVVAVAILEWRAHQFALTESQLIVRAGWWKRKLTILPIRKIQSVDVRQSPLDLPLGLASVSIGVAGGSGNGPLSVGQLPMANAMTLRQQLLG